MPMREDNKILCVYAALIISLVLMLVPHVVAGALSLLLFMGVLVGGYVLRRRNDSGGLMADHMTFIIRTIWIGSGLAVLTTTVAALYMHFNADPTPLADCSQNVADAVLGGATPDLQSLAAMMQPCIIRFLSENDIVMTIALLVSAGPPLFYFVLRIARGLGRAKRGHRIGDHQSWL